MQSKSGCAHQGKVACPERQGPTTQLIERANAEVYSSKLAPTMGPTTRLSGGPCPASSRPTPKP
eukprot:1155365-Pelagomonas_calceolata.AAC.2